VSDVIHELIEKEATMRVAGGFTIDDPLLRKYVDHIEGDEDSVLGLPLKLTEDLIQQVAA
jgi:predicted house-cleaning NTP pyrophosphatase (Maf/HAM1 superfamily)